MPRVNDVALVERRQQILARLRATTAAAVVAAWDSLDAYTDDQVEVFVRRASPAVAAGQERAFFLTLAHLRALLGTDVPADLGLLERAAVDLHEPFIALGRSLNGGSSFEEAVAAGRSRASGIAESGVQWASRAANAAADDHVTGWRRTLTGKACSWCQQVSQQIYRTAESASFGHAHCDCGVDPIIGQRDPGRTVNANVLNDLADDES